MAGRQAMDVVVATRMGLMAWGVFMFFATFSYAGVQNNVDMAEFLGKHDLRWDAAPGDRGDSAFLGNGLFGSTIWSARNEVLHWDLGRSDVYDTAARVKSRIPVGKLVLRLGGKTAGQTMHQSLHRAEATGAITTDRGEMSWRCIMPREQMVGLVEYRLSGSEQADFEFFQLPAIDSGTLRNGLRDLLAKSDLSKREQRIVDFSNPAFAPFIDELKKDPKVSVHPPAKTGKIGQISWLVQPFRDGGGYMVAWGVRNLGAGRALCAYTLDYEHEGDVTEEKAVSDVSRALAAGYRQLAVPHWDWWREYYARSFLSIPDRKVERYYWIQIYKMAAAMRPDGPVLDEIGPWLRATGWARVWCNTNIQILYHSTMTSNRLELCKPFITLFNSNKPVFEAVVPEKYRTEGAMALGRTMDIFGSTGWHWEFGNLTWALHDYWMYCRYTGNETLEKEEFYPLLRGAVRFMMAGLMKDGQGVYHMAPDVSPEYSNERYLDTVYNLATLRWGLKVLTFLSRKHGLNDPDEARWDDVMASLAPYPLNENGFMVAAGVPFAASHRHYSHLMAFWPLLEQDPDAPKGHALFRTSYDHWVKLATDRNVGWNGFSFFGAAGMAAWLRDGNEALRQLRNGADWTTPSTFFKGPGPAIESVLCGTVGTTEMLLQSATADPAEFRLRVFPALADGWKDVSFDKLMAEGAFEVSAQMREGRLQFVQITSNAGNPCRVEAPFAGPVKAFGKREFTITKTKDKYGRPIHEVDLRKGETVVLAEASAAPESLAIDPVRGR
ncbi:MAG: hypothetical protein HN742_39550 [Lentisphaerae bacterium]|jgi:alpha-L-fucosidase 2|nr:hypothetical protein [Lentisphaerota bacterium]MBT4822165.1 hypothetical protein [Lentisphaerota bacterium]MBT5612450.1 hypothetical protein [Lentisphaerota bacterium]MBT7057156.1 hypothetical protein [Lentisphaerota bacterium]MBT7848030.1 hypothetical protein [Lentisphaerota bacterium]